jgi:tetratricopeptide (TPR) repeat protein
MKSKRRHELHTNLLADWLGEMIERIKPYQNAILGTTILVLVAIIAIVVWRSHSVSQAGEAWADVPLVAGSPEAYEQVEQRHPQTAAAEWATVLAADQYLRIGASDLFMDKDQAKEALNHAIENYEKAFKESRSPLLQERAAFGMARTQECLGRLDDAAKNYELVIKRWPKGMFHSAAEDRLQDLQRPSTKRFYDDFASFSPKPPAKEAGSSPKVTLPPLPEFPPEPPRKDKDEGGRMKAEGGAKAPAKAETPAKTEPPAKVDTPAKVEPPAKAEPAAKAEPPARAETPAKEAKPAEPKSPQTPEPPAKPESPAKE